MNDFTKDELTIIYLAMSGIYCKPLKDKIESMIDNYCEHESSQPLRSTENYMSILNNQPYYSKCTDCKKRIINE